MSSSLFLLCKPAIIELEIYFTKNTFTPDNRIEYCIFSSNWEKKVFKVYNSERVTKKEFRNGNEGKPISSLSLSHGLETFFSESAFLSVTVAI